MSKGKISVICDERTVEDAHLGRNAQGLAWDQRPYYLLNKVLRDRENVDYILIDEIGRNSFEGSDMAFLHLDMSQHPEQYSQALRLAIPPNVPLFNGGITNTSKDFTEGMYVGMGGPALSLSNPDTYDGKVILKSIHNAGDPGGRGYRVMPIQDVTEADWSDLEIMVQPFVSSKENPLGEGFGRMDRHVLFLGESVICSFYSREPIIKRKTSIWEYFRDIRHLEGDLQDQQRVCLNDSGIFYRSLSQDETRNQKTVLDYAKTIGLDFGSMDTITGPDGNLHILDVNKTTWERGIPQAFIRLFANQLR